jgi:GNAT superfamily N-acetyltransferase
MLTIRLYEPRDERTCRDLWVELTEHHRRLYDDPTIGGDDPGAYFGDVYLPTPERLATWVAVEGGDVVGLTGLFDHGSSGEVEPVVVSERARGRGIGRRLLETAIEESRRRGHEWIAVRPVARNIPSIAAFHAVGVRTLGGLVDLTLDLRPRRHEWHENGSLHGLPFRW